MIKAKPNFLIWTLTLILTGAVPRASFRSLKIMTLSKKLRYTAEISLTVSWGKKSDLVYENLGPFRPIGLNSQNLPVVPITKCTSRFVKFGLNLKF